MRSFCWTGKSAVDISCKVLMSLTPFHAKNDLLVISTALCDIKYSPELVTSQLWRSMHRKRLLALGFGFIKSPEKLLGFGCIESP